MSNSKFEYVKKFEADDKLLPNSWIVVRIDGKNFHKFSEKHEFQKPNDKSALNLMNASATAVIQDFPDLLMAYGQSDEYSFIFRKDTQLYSRRSNKLMTNIVSLFASNFVFQWPKFFPEKTLQYPPTFDARCVVYPTNKNIRDYLSWRQADCHINNLYNTVFWALVLKGNMTNVEAEKRLRGTFSSDKNEILFSEFNMNYNNEDDQFKKGTILYKKKVDIPIEEKSKIEKISERETPATKVRWTLLQENRDFIGDEFWIENDHLLSPYQNS